MRIAATGIVTNEYNDILLIQRDDTLTWSAPGGSLEPGELPTTGVTREVKEETGMYVLPVRLVSTSFWREQPHAHLHLTFRCLIRGGKPTPSAESPQVGFFPARSLPRPMLGPHRERVERARYHAGPAVWYSGGISWLSTTVTRMTKYTVQAIKFRGAAGKNNASENPRPPLWNVYTYVLIPDGQGGVLWRQGAGDRPSLPGGQCKAQEAPWEAAGRFTRSQTGYEVTLEQLTGLYVRPESTEMIFVFRTAALDGVPLIDQPYLDESHSADPFFESIISEGLASGDETVIGFWPVADRID